MIFRDLKIRPFINTDLAQLERWRREYFGPSSEYELPFGWTNTGVETAVAEYKGTPIAALSGSKSAFLGPLVKDVSVNGPEMFAAIYSLGQTLGYQAQLGGAMDVYLSTPEDARGYHAILEKSGYTRLRPATWFWRPLAPIVELEEKDKRK